MHRIVIALAVAATSVAVPPVAATPVAAPPYAAPPPYAVADLIRVAAATGLGELARVLHSVPGLRLPAEPAPPEAQSWALPAPDLDGDGRDDVVDLRATDSTTPVESRLGYWYHDTVAVGRSSRDGRELWRRTGRRTAMLPFLARVGPRGAPGLLEIHVDVNWSTLSVIHLGFVALDLRGRLVAERHFAERDGAVPRLGGFAPAPGAPARVVLGLPHPHAVTGVAVQPAVLAMAGTATPEPVGPPVVAGPAGAWVSGVGDLDGDRYADIAVSGRDLPGGTPALEVRSARGAAVLWRTALPGDTLGARAAGAGDVTADGVPDLTAVIQPAGPAGGGGWRVALHDGATGAARWTVPGYAAHALGDANGAPGAEVAVADAGRTAAYGGGGDPVWETAYDARPGVITGHGDVDGDGVLDLFHMRSGYAYGWFEETAVVSGGTGRIRERGAARRTRTDPATSLTTGRSEPLHRSAVDGRTPDLVRVEVAGDGESFAVVAIDGWTGAELWRALVPLAVTTVGELRARHVDDDRCAEVVVPVTGAANGLLAFRSDGTLLWAVGRGAHGDVPLRLAVTTRTTHTGCA